MRILVAHNRYQQSGGEDQAVENEVRLLRSRHHLVRVFERSNHEIQNISQKFRTAVNASYSKDMRRQFEIEIRHFKPDLVHVHNFFPLLTPSIYDACKAHHVPIVQTLHNYRTLCANSLFSRNGRVCVECLAGSPYRAAAYGCYRGSRLGSLAVARMIDRHQKEKTWKTKVDQFIALSQFARSLFVEGGFPSDRISVKSNFADDFFHPHVESPRDGKVRALFVGRLSEEKGLRTLLRAWERISENPRYELRVVGSGPLDEKLKSSRTPGLSFLGKLPFSQIREEMNAAQFLVLPSECFENFPLTVVEAFSAGIPTLVSGIGSMEEIVEPGKTGLHFSVGSVDSLALKLQILFENMELRETLGRNARSTYLKLYTPEKNYDELVQIYSKVLGREIPRDAHVETFSDRPSL